MTLQRVVFATLALVVACGDDVTGIRSQPPVVTTEAGAEESASPDEHPIVAGAAPDHDATAGDASDPDGVALPLGHLFRWLDVDTTLLTSTQTVTKWLDRAGVTRGGKPSGFGWPSASRAVLA